MSGHGDAMAMDADLPVPPGVDPAVPSPARLYDYYLGGKTNYESDRMWPTPAGLNPQLEALRRGTCAATAAARRRRPARCLLRG